jgi:hypothetical protein
MPLCFRANLQQPRSHYSRQPGYNDRMGAYVAYPLRLASNIFPGWFALLGGILIYLFLFFALIAIIAFAWALGNGLTGLILDLKRDRSEKKS